MDMKKPVNEEILKYPVRVANRMWRDYIVLANGHGGEKWLEKEAEYADTFANPYRAAERGIIDEVLLPSETRAALISAYKMLEKKAEALPQKKHGNIPL